MKTLAKTFLYFIVLIAITSCTQDFPETSPKDNLQTIETGTLNFIYKGTSYTSEYSRLSDSTVIFKNNQVSELSKLLATKSNLISYIHSDGSLEYIETEKEAEIKVSEQIAKVTQKTISTKGVIETKGVGPFLTFCEADCRLYRHSNYGGWYIQSVLNHCSGPMNIVENKIVGSRDNKVSSIKVFTRRDPNANVDFKQFSGTLRLYQYADLKGKSLVLPFMNVYNEINIPSLKKYPLYPGSKDNWNDTVSSFSIGYID